MVSKPLKNGSVKRLVCQISIEVYEENSLNSLKKQFFDPLPRFHLAFIKDKK